MDDEVAIAEHESSCAFGRDAEGRLIELEINGGELRRTFPFSG